MGVIVVSKVERDGGMVDVTLSRDGTRFTVSVPAIIAASEDAETIYQQMANTVCREADSLRSIVKANQGL